MQHMSRRLVASAAALALVAGGGAAYAATGSHSASKGGGRGAIKSAVAAYLGLTAQQLRADLKGGETLAQITSAQGKTVSGLEQSIEAAIKTRLDQAVTAGRLTSQREQQILSLLPARLDKLVNVSHPGALTRHKLGALRRGLISVSATYLGLTPQSLRSELRTGKTLAQVATAQGKTAAGLEQSIEAAIKTRLDKAVTAGKLTSQREQQILSRLPARLDKLVNHTFTHA
jgi:pyrroline-5-carboxylate reductase